MSDTRMSKLLEKANSLIDKISDSMRIIENVEAAKRRFLRADSSLSLEMPTQGTGGLVDVFKLEDIFDEKGIEKIKAYILSELELLEESNLKLLEAAGFAEHCQDNAPQTEPIKAEPEAAGSEIPFVDFEDDSDMIVVPERLEKKVGKPIDEKTIEKIGELAESGMRPSEIARHVGVSQPTASRYSKKYAETVANKETKPGRSVSRR